MEGVAQTAKQALQMTRDPNTQDITLTPIAEHKYTVIWMHGLGDSAEGFLSFFYARDSVIPKFANTKVILL